MPLITARKEVLEIYSDAAKENWVIPCFCS